MQHFTHENVQNQHYHKKFPAMFKPDKSEYFFKVTLRFIWSPVTFGETQETSDDTSVSEEGSQGILIHNLVCEPNFHRVTSDSF